MLRSTLACRLFTSPSSKPIIERDPVRHSDKGRGAGARANWTPRVRLLIQLPFVWTNSPAEIIAEWPIKVIRSRCPRALTRSTQKPFSSL
jgi:hypothetical protein